MKKKQKPIALVIVIVIGALLLGWYLNKPLPDAPTIERTTDRFVPQINNTIETKVMVIDPNEQ